MDCNASFKKYIDKKICYDKIYTLKVINEI